MVISSLLRMIFEGITDANPPMKKGGPGHPLVPSDTERMFPGAALICSYLDKEKSLQQKVKQHVSNDFTDTGERLRLPPRHLEC